jgi:hypothetical protein
VEHPVAGSFSFPDIHRHVSSTPDESSSSQYTKAVVVTPK